MKYVRRRRFLAAFYFLLWFSQFAPGGRHVAVQRNWFQPQPLTRRAHGLPLASLRIGPVRSEPKVAAGASAVELHDPVFRLSEGNH